MTTGKKTEFKEIWLFTYSGKRRPTVMQRSLGSSGAPQFKTNYQQCKTRTLLEVVEHDDYLKKMVEYMELYTPFSLAIDRYRKIIAKQTNNSKWINRNTNVTTVRRVKARFVEETSNAV